MLDMSLNSPIAGDVLDNSLQGIPPLRNGGLSELALFRQMQRTFERFYNAVVVEETHQHYVKFIEGFSYAGSPIWRKKEISDLLIIAYSPNRKVARATFLQAKVARACKNEGLIKGQFLFSGDSHQYHLLSERPLVDIPRFQLFDVPILRDAILPSIGSYGVFYEEKHFVRFAYQPANKLICRNIDRSGIASLMFNKNVPKYNTPYKIPDLQYTLSTKEFEYAVTHLLVGSPITYMKDYHIVYDRVFAIFRDSIWGSSSQYDRVIKGVDQFLGFIWDNRDLLELDALLGSSLERYASLNRYLPSEEQSTNWDDTVWYSEEIIDRGKGFEGEFCQGPISLILINVDEIPGN